MSSAPLKADLTAKHLWSITFKLAKAGFKSQEAVARIRFVQNVDYEPPQGKVYVEDDFNGFLQADEQGFAGKWTLSVS